MKRKFIALVTAVIMLFSLALPVNAQTEPTILINLSTTTVGANDKTVNMSYYISAEGSDTSNNISDISIALSGTGEFSVLSGATEVTDAQTNFPYNFVMEIPTTLKSTSQYLTFDITYTYNGKENKVRKFVQVTVSGTATESVSSSLTIQNAAYKSEVISGASNTLTADIVNNGTKNVSEVTASLIDTSTKNTIASKYIGAIETGSVTAIEMPFAITDIGNHDLALSVTYKDGTSSKTVQYDFSVNVTGSLKLSIRNLAFEKTIYTEETQTVTFNLVNTSDESFIDAQAYIYNGDKSIATVYIGTAAAHEQTAGTITYSIADKSEPELTLKVKYKNTAGNTLTSQSSFNVTVIQSIKNNDAGALKIQSVTAPASIAVDTIAQIPFAITNPTQTAVTGAEVNLYDEAGNTVDSIFISSMEPCTSTDFNFDLLSKTIGTKAYTVSLTYQNKDKQKFTEKKSFTLEVKTAEQQEETVEKPADMRIAKIDKPSQLYTGVNTEIPFSIANGGKGTAYNVEVYITDDNGNEYAREYIGNITASTKTDTSLKVKMSETGEYNLTLNVYFENFDETKETKSKTFTQKVSDYRASIADISGLEYVMANSQTNVTFSVLNSGSVQMLNAQATLTDANGTTYGTVFIGTIEANSKKEKNKFKNVIFSDTSVTNLTITVTYENTDADVFSFSSDSAVTVQEMYIDDGMYDDGMGYDDGMIGDETTEITDENGTIIGYDDNGNPIYQSNGLPVWAIVLIAVGGAAIVAVVVIIIVKKKKKSKEDGDDMDYFYAQKNDTADKK